MKIYEMTPRKDSRHSFYEKAHILIDKGDKILLSYSTKVCTIKNKEFKLNKSVDKELLFSMTTLRHIKEFLFQELGILTLTKKDLERTLGKWAKIKDNKIVIKGE